MNEELDDTTSSAQERLMVLPKRHLKLGLVQLHPVSTSAPQRVWTLGRYATIGRGVGCDVRLEDGTASRLHARLETRAQRAFVTDAGSRFGTFVDRRCLNSALVEVFPGSVLRVGHTLLLLVEDPDRYESTPRRLSASFIGLPHDVFAGPETWDGWQLAMTAAPLDHPVLIVGPSGTGKEIIARLLHLSRQQPSKLVALNLAAVPEALFEAELFGCARGAFTGATQAKPGAFGEAAGGTLFLDEVGELRPELQVKLLRALETGTIRPLGSSGDVRVSTRVIAATNRDLKGAVDAGTFRADLFYRLSGLVVRTCPLRQRRDEILVVARSLLEREAPGVVLSTDAAYELLLRPWDGNLRELYHVIVRAALAARATGSDRLLPDHLPNTAIDPDTPESRSAPLTEEALRRALRRAAGNATKAAALLGISRATLYNFCARHQLDLSAMRTSSESTDAGREE